MFDYVRCEYPLPDKEAQNEVFQTKDFECLRDTYFITSDGKLFMKGAKQRDPMLIQFQGDICFSTALASEQEGETVLYEYLARFTKGKLQYIKRLKNTV
jgi:hypothetical protein